MAYVFDNDESLPPISDLPLDLASLDEQVVKKITAAHVGSDRVGLSTLLAEEARAETFPYISADVESPLYNDAYAAASLILAYRLMAEAKFLDVLRVVDLGMLRGGIEKWSSSFLPIAHAAQKLKDNKTRPKPFPASPVSHRSSTGPFKESEKTGITMTKVAKVAITQENVPDEGDEAENVEVLDYSPYTFPPPPPKKIKLSPAPNLHSSGSPIPRIPVASLSASQFASDYLNPSRPCIIKLEDEQCPPWTFRVLKSRIGCRLVPVEVYDEKDRTKGYLGER
mmetsp:Transcript_12126/g.24795  ORF Transcript_12126/g.24795 Transcript_12126/m.24795 type:complete len:282 (-) Transcript_12126:715-1560(-)